MKFDRSLFNNGQVDFYISSRRLSASQPKHEHSFYEILYITEGERDFLVGDRIYHAQKGDFIFIGPHVLHTATIHNSSECDCLLVYVTEGFLERTGCTACLEGWGQRDKFHLQLPLKDQEDVGFLLRHTLFEGHQQSWGYSVMMTSFLMRMIILIGRVYDHNRELKNSQLSPKQEKVSEILSYLQQNYQEELNLQMIADKFYLSAPYLSKIFKEVTNYNFVEYLNCLRVSEAKKLLKNKKNKIIDVAAEVGFGSITHFGKVFKDVTGHPPRYYRHI